MKIKLSIYAMHTVMLASSAVAAEYNTSAHPSTEGAPLMIASQGSSILAHEFNELKEIQVTEQNYPTNGNHAYSPDYVYGGHSNVSPSINIYGHFEDLEGDYSGDTVINITSGSVTAVMGGNFGNENGASFAGDTTINVHSAAATYIMGASWLGQNTSSTFTGSTQVNVYTTTHLIPVINTDWMGFNSAAIAGGFIGGVFGGTTEAADQFNVITGDTHVMFDFQNLVDPSELGYNVSRIDMAVSGGSQLVGGVDSKIMGTSRVSITNMAKIYDGGYDKIQFSDTITGGDASYSSVPPELFGENTGANKSNSFVNATALTIEGGIFKCHVIGGSGSFGGGDITVGSSDVDITGGVFEQILVGGSMMGLQSQYGIAVDTSSGRIHHGDVSMDISNAITNGLIAGLAISSGVSLYDTTEDSHVGNITLTLGGWDESGEPLGGRHNSYIVGGSQNGANIDAITVHQGDVVINALSGTLAAEQDMIAAGVMGELGRIHGTSTSVTIGDDFIFEEKTNVYGGFDPNGYESNGTLSGKKLLSFTDSDYDFERPSSVTEKQNAVTFHDFDEVHVEQAGTHVDAEGMTTLQTLNAEQLTKSGAGTFEVEAGYGDTNVHVTGGTLQINTQRFVDGTTVTSRLLAGTVDTVTIDSGARVTTDTLTIDRNAIVVKDSSVGLVAKDVKGGGTIHATSAITVNQEWTEGGLDAITEGAFTMITGADVHLQSLRAQSLVMDDSAHLRVDKLLDAASVSIAEYASLVSASTPYITAHDMLSSTTENLFTFDFSSESIANMVLESNTPYLIADLSASALATAGDKSFIFQIDGIGDTFTQQIAGETYYLGTINEDVYIYREGQAVIPEPSTMALSVLALGGLLARRRRQRV